MLKQASLQLPTRWKWIRLGEICKIAAGGTPSRFVKEYWNGNIPWVKISDIPKDGFIYQTEEMITKKGLENSNTKIFPKGTILFTIFATIGKVGILGIDAAINQAIVGITPDTNVIDSKYLYYCLKKFGLSLLMIGRGGAQKNVNQSILKKLLIPLPPLEEQKRIVAKLDEIFSKIEKARKLREEALKEAEQIMQSALNEVFSKAEEKGWKWGSFFNVVIECKTGIPIKKSDRIHGRYPYFGANGIIDYINDYNFDGEYILIAQDGSIGAIHYFNGKFWGNNHLWAIKVKSDVYTKFLYYFLKTVNWNKLIRGATRPKVTKNYLSLIKIPLPPLEEQKRIADYLDKLQEKIELLKKHQEETQKEIEMLTSSILNKAFRGELL